MYYYGSACRGTDLHSGRLLYIHIYYIYIYTYTVDYFKSEYNRTLHRFYIRQVMFTCFHSLSCTQHDTDNGPSSCVYPLPFRDGFMESRKSQSRGAQAFGGPPTECCYRLLVENGLKETFLNKETILKSFLTLPVSNASGRSHLVLLKELKTIYDQQFRKSIK